MYDIALNEPDKMALQKALDYSMEWCAKHQCGIGETEWRKEVNV